MKGRRRAVYIEWADSTSFSAQRWRGKDESEGLTPAFIKSVGWLLSASKEQVLITSSISDDDDRSGCLAIPRGCITRMRRLK